MSLNDTMKKHMDAVRKVSGTTGKMSVREATKLLTSYLGLKVVTVNYHELTQNISDPGWYNSQGKLLSGKPANVADSDIVEVVVLQDNQFNKAQLFFVNNVVWARRNNTNGWTAWQKLGGVLKSLLATKLPRLEVCL